MADETVNQRGTDTMLRWFEFEHLPADLQATSSWFSHVAHQIVACLDRGDQRQIALQRLLEAKDAAVRAKLHPGS